MKTYNPKLINVVVNGILITGFADGDFVTVETDADLYTSIVGATGEVVRTKNLNRMATVTLTLMADSPTNDLLSALAIDAEGLAPVGSFLLSNTNGTTIASAPSCWLKKMPSIAYGVEAGTREWQFACDELTWHVGGATV